MRKSIFFRMAWLIIAIIIVLDAVVLFVSYRVTYDTQLSVSTERIKRNALAAKVYMETHYPENTDEGDDISEYFDIICYTSGISYLYAIYPDSTENTLTYYAIGFGEDASQDVISIRYSGIKVSEVPSPKMLAAFNGNDSGLIEQYENQFGKFLVCYMPLSEYYDIEKEEYVKLDKPLVIGAEENILTIVSAIQKRFAKIAFLTIILTLIIVLSVFLILYFKISKPVNKISKKMNSFVSDREKGFEKLPVKGNDEFAEMSRSFNSMTEEIDTYIRNIDQMTKEKHTHQAEMDIARNIQSGLLRPSSFCTGDISINAYMRAAKNVGGDLYDYAVLEDGRVWLAIADVSGKGISAALFMARGLTLLHQYALLGYSPAQILSVYNEALAEQNPGLFFITTFAAVYDPKTRELRYANGGHNLPYILSDQLITLDGSLGVAAGIFAHAKYQEATVRMKEGDVLFLYTDGVNESVNKDGGFFGTEALEEELKRHIGGDTDNLAEDVLKRLREFSKDAEQSDDITVLTMKITDEPKNN